MRTLTHGDVVAAACLVRGLGVVERKAELARLLWKADVADRFRKRTGRMHPRWGNGSLMAAAMAAGAKIEEPFLSDSTYLDSLATVFEAILDWRVRDTQACASLPFPEPRNVLSLPRQERKGTGGGGSAIETGTG